MCLFMTHVPICVICHYNLHHEMGNWAILWKQLSCYNFQFWPNLTSRLTRTNITFRHGHSDFWEIFSWCKLMSLNLDLDRHSSTWYRENWPCFPTSLYWRLCQANPSGIRFILLVTLYYHEKIHPITYFCDADCHAVIEVFNFQPFLQTEYK